MFEFGLIARADGDACVVPGEFAGEDQAPRSASYQDDSLSEIESASASGGLLRQQKSPRCQRADANEILRVLPSWPSSIEKIGSARETSIG